MSLESPKHECGVIGIYSPGSQVSNDLYYGLVSLQNRGQEAAGMGIFNDRKEVSLHTGLGLVYTVFPPEVMDKLCGSVGTGHVRYGTTGDSSIKSAQPFLVDSNLGPFLFSQNGNIMNADQIRDDLEANGTQFNSTSDGEVMAQQIAQSHGRTFVEKIKNAASIFRGGYSCVIAAQDSLVGFKDPHGIWPLHYGKINGNGHIIASETNATDRLSGHSIQELKHGEIVSITENAVSWDSLGQAKPASCLFDPIYFADPSSILGGERVAASRFRMGQLLAKEHPIDADIIVPVPETGNFAAQGLAYETGIPYLNAIIRNRWYGRTFIEPSQRVRDDRANYKYQVTPELIEMLGGKRVIMVDDSIVRGTTTPKVIKLMRDARVHELNMLITAPPTIGVCFFGVDTAAPEELIAAYKSVPEIGRLIGADYLGYLSLESVLKAVRGSKDNYCTGCFDLDYPLKVPSGREKLVLVESL